MSGAHPPANCLIDVCIAPRIRKASAPPIAPFQRGSGRALASLPRFGHVSRPVEPIPSTIRSVHANRSSASVARKPFPRQPSGARPRARRPRLRADAARPPVRPPCAHGRETRRPERGRGARRRHADHRGRSRGRAGGPGAVSTEHRGGAEARHPDRLRDRPEARREGRRGREARRQPRIPEISTARRRRRPRPRRRARSTTRP